jgi:hypothetical protein
MPRHGSGGEAPGRVAACLGCSVGVLAGGASYRAYGPVFRARLWSGGAFFCWTATKQSQAPKDQFNPTAGDLIARGDTAGGHPTAGKGEKPETGARLGEHHAGVHCLYAQPVGIVLRERRRGDHAHCDAHQRVPGTGTARCNPAG